jgi:hypothetical protein
VDVATKVCLHDFQEIVIPLCKSMYPVCDLTLQESDR